MSRCILCGGLVVEAATTVLSLPGVSETVSVSGLLAGGLMAVLPSVFQFLNQVFAILLAEPPAQVAFARLPLRIE